MTFIARGAPRDATDANVQALVQKCESLDPIPPLCEAIIEAVGQDPKINEDKLAAFIADYFGIEGTLGGNLGPVLPPTGTSKERRQDLGGGDIHALIQKCEALDPTPPLCEVILRKIEQDPDVSEKELAAAIWEYFGAAAASEGNPGPVLTTPGSFPPAGSKSKRKDLGDLRSFPVIQNGNPTHDSRKPDISTRAPQVPSGADLFAFLKSTLGIEVASVLGGLGLGSILNAGTLGSRAAQDKSEERAFPVIWNGNPTHRSRSDEKAARDIMATFSRGKESEVKYNRDVDVGTKSVDPASIKESIIEAVAAMSVADVVELISAIEEKFLPGLGARSYQTPSARGISNRFSGRIKEIRDTRTPTFVGGLGTGRIPSVGALTPRTEAGKTLRTSSGTSMVAAEKKREEGLKGSSG